MTWMEYSPKYFGKFIFNLEIFFFYENAINLSEMHRNDIALDAFTSASIFFRKMLFEMDIVRLNIDIEYD